MKMEARNRKLVCLVTLPDSVVLAIEVDKSADGNDVLKQVCEKIGSIETDFFGLQYLAAGSEELLWLNLRNRLTSELTGSPPYRLSFNVKFFVQPHSIQQESTRTQFYLAVRRDFLDGSLRVDALDAVQRFSALLAQAELTGDPSDHFHASSTLADHESCLPAACRSADNVAGVKQRQKELGRMTRSAARAQFLREAAALPSYGVHWHEAYDDELKRFLHVDIGPEGVALSDQARTPLNWVPYAALQRAVHDSLAVDVYTAEDDASIVRHRLTLATKSAANALYRDLTEMFSFFHCDTVRSIVAEQFCRDFKGTIVSLFNERTDLGKKYVFDIERTLQEAIDRTRRILYNSRSQTEPAPLAAEATRRPSGSQQTESGDATEAVCCQSRQHAEMLQQIEAFHSAFTCHVCADAEISTALVPCGHVLCCVDCAHKLASCPLCKRAIDLVLPIYLPSTRPSLHPATAPAMSHVGHQQACCCT